MKNALTSALLFVFATVLTVIPSSSQTIADPPSVFGRFDGQTYIFSPTYSIFNGSNIGTMMIDLDTTNLVAFNQTKFYLGHQWGTASRNVNKRLHNNFNNENLYYSDFRQIIFGAADTSQPYFVSWKMGDFFGYYGAMQFDPDAALEGANGTFIPRTGDSTGAAFGFQYKDTVAGRLTNNPADVNFRRYALTKDSISTPRLVLKNIEAANKLVSYDTTQLVGSAAWEKEMNDNGQRWYMALNLRRTNAADTITDTAVVLTIKLSWVKFPHEELYIQPNPIDTTKLDTFIIQVRDSGYVRFDSMSAVRVGGTYDTIRTDRGLMDAKLLDSVQTPDFEQQTFYIRRNMLPRRANPDSNDITVSAFFTALGGAPLIYNPRLRGYNVSTYDRIDSLDIEVTYHGNADVAIDWIRLETPRARQLLRGELDREFAARLSVLMDTLRYWRDTKGFSKLRLAAIYLNDEPGGRPAEWRAFRYQAKFLDRLATTEGAFDNRYCHVVPQRNYWGSVPASGGKVPYYPYTMHGPFGTSVQDSLYNANIQIKSVPNLGYNGGVRPYNFYNDSLRKHDRQLIFDSLCSPDDGSGYEKYTFLSGGYFAQCDSVKPTPYIASVRGLIGYASDPAKAIMSSNISALSVIDTSYLQYLCKSPEILFSETPWHSNFWLMSQWLGRYKSEDDIRYAFTIYNRPKTGEEVRREIWSALALGAKGLMYDRWMCHPALADTATPSTDTAKYIPMRSGTQELYIGVTGGADSAYGGNIDPALDGVNADSLLFGDEAGGDFVQHRDYSRLDQYINFDNLEYALGVPRSRIYLGRKSMRLEIRKIHDWIYTVSDTLMNMQLMGWWGKGYRPWKLAKDGDTSKYINSLLALDSGRFQSRSTLRPTAIEGWDSTFFDVGTFQRKDGSKPITDEFFVSVVNRRSSPLIRNSHTGDTLRFYTTHEFDSLTLNEYGNLPDSTRDFWAEQRYMQTGSRIITLPFNYTDTLGRYALLRVRELGAGNAYLDSVYPYRTNRALYDVVDTVVGQDKSITFKLLPGEGKIFRVEILRSNEVSGDLSHSNQTKIVSHNIMRRENGTGKWIEGDSLVYYMTYHKPAPLLPMLPPRTAVYFRKSKPTSRWDNNAALQWENEYCLTDTVYHSGRWNIGDSCAYPSIVVRFDSTSEEYRAYIVYSCIKHDTTNNPLYEWQFITESIVRINNDTAIDTVLPGKVLDSVKSLNMSEWGTPMINASDTANFYCYADKNRGIIASWRRPRDLTDTLRKLVSTTRISWGDPSFCTITAKHPSMNPYSPYIRGEHHSDCALVWQESDNCDMLRSQIHYTRLFIMNNNTIFHDLPPYILSSPFFANADTSIWCVSCDSLPPSSDDNHSFPVVYRDLFYPDTNTAICNWQVAYPGHTRHDLRIDNIAWESVHSYILPSFPPIFNRSVYINRRVMQSIDDFTGGVFVPDTANALWPETIWSEGIYDYLWGATLSAGEAEYHFPSALAGCFNYSLRGVALDFNYASMLQMIGYPPYSIVYHTALPTSVALATIPIWTIAEGNTPYMAHLSARGTVYRNDWQRGRHIYNSDTITPPTIRTSGREFYKRANNSNPTAETLYGFGRSDSRFVVGALRFGGQDYPLQPKQAFAPSLFPTPPDTLVTEWFRVGESELAELISAGGAPEQTEVWLERRSDGSRWLVQMGAGEERQLARLDIRLENGNDEEYRLEILNAIGGTFRRETVLNADGDAMERGMVRGEWLINLGVTDAAQTLSIFPNPASDEVHIAVRGEERAEVIILDAFGRTIQATAMKSGGVLAVATADFVAGLYAVRVRRSGLPDVGGRFIVVR